MQLSKRLYTLAALAEECGEAVQLVGKIIRFGEDDYHPKTGNIPNIELLRREVNEIFAVADVLGIKRDTELIEAKYKRLDLYWLYANEPKSNQQCDTCSIIFTECTQRTPVANCFDYVKKD